MGSLYKGGRTMVRIILAILTWLVLVTVSLRPILRPEGELQTVIQETMFEFNEEQTAQDRPVTATEFPVFISGTDLQVIGLALYEGNMLEDKSESFLVDAAALELYNCGNREIAMAEVTLKFDAVQMVFFATNIPAGAKILVIEREGQLWTQENCNECCGWVQYSDDSPLSEESLRIEDIDMGTVSVTNLTEEPVYDLGLFYKNYLSDAGMYIGGITYIYQIEYLAPGQTLLITPEYYASGYSEFIKAVEME